MFAMGFGGFTFYSGIVIPTAHYVIREPMLFGFVTQTRHLLAQRIPCCLSLAREL